MPDKIDEAIAAAGTQTRTVDVQLVQLPPVKMPSTGRYFAMLLPPNTSVVEMADIAQWMAGQVLFGLKQQDHDEQVGPSIALPDGRRVPVKPLL